MFGSGGDTGRLRLYQGENQSVRNKFERGRTDLFKLEAADIGKIDRIIIGVQLTLLRRVKNNIKESFL